MLCVHILVLIDEFFYNISYMCTYRATSYACLVSQYTICNLSIGE